RRRLFSRKAQGKPRQHDDRDVLPGSTVELHVLPSAFQRARARLRRHTRQFSLSLSSWPMGTSKIKKGSEIGLSAEGSMTLAFCFTLEFTIPHCRNKPQA